MQTISSDEFQKRYGISGVSSFTAPPPKAGLASRISDVVNKAGESVYSNITGTGENAGQSPIRRGTQAVAAGFNAVPQTALAASPEPVRNAASKVGDVVGSGFKKLTDFIGSNQQLQKFVMENPEVAKALEEVAGTASAGGQIAGTILLADQTSKALQYGSDKTVQGVRAGVNKGSNSADDAIAWGKDMKEKLQIEVGRKTVTPQLETSVVNIRNMRGVADRVDDPLTAYDKYLNQSKSAAGSIRVDEPISLVGEKVGDAFKQVISQRREVGKTIGSELKTNGNLKIGITEPKSKLFSELEDGGLSYNPRTNQLNSFTGTKFASDEIDMLEGFVARVQKLGENPSVSSIDDFISKTRSELAFTKGQNGVIGTTNAERIINGALSGLRETLNPAKNKLPQLAKYWEANNTYSQLSDFVDEGSGFLGKITQSGDFAKDASLLKSSVQSILNNGKKDWLIKLEQLTGYNSLDDAVLALQAMKDAGSFKGLSLLETLNTGAIPTSQSGVWNKVLDYATRAGARAVVGTPEEQTRAFLKSLLEPAKKELPLQTKPVPVSPTNIKTKSPNPQAGSVNFFAKSGNAKGSQEFDQLQDFIAGRKERLDMLRAQGMSENHPSYKAIVKAISEAFKKANALK